MHEKVLNAAHILIFGHNIQNSASRLALPVQSRHELTNEELKAAVVTEMQAYIDGHGKFTEMTEF